MSGPSEALARRGGTELAAVMPAEMSIEELVARTRKVQEAMKAVMHEGEHYGVIPGTGSKPTLLKPGAEKLLNLFMLDPEYDAPPLYEGDHLTIVSRCTLFHIPTGSRVGSGMGMCSTREVKYAYRTSKRACPKCGAEAINKSKFPPKGRRDAAPGWYCYAKVGGCGVEFDADDPAITGQTIGRVDNPDKADQYNTVLKMANKRSLVAAVLNVTGASDIFTQDLEDLPAAERPVTTEAAAPDTGKTAEELFETPTEEAERKAAERDVLLGRLAGRWDSLRTPAAARVKTWERLCGTAAYMTTEATPDQLRAVLDSLGEKA